MPTPTSQPPPREPVPAPEPTSDDIPHPNRRRSPTDRLRPRRRNWLMILSMIVGLLVIGLIYYRTTYVSGLELNSHTWEQRVFSLRRDPFTGWQLGGVRHNAPARINMWTTIENPRAKKMGPSILKYFSAQPAEPLRWDLIRLDDSQLPGARASILVDLLAARDRDDEPLWPEWTQRHPERAAVLWPAAQRLVAADQYTWLPQLFEQAMQENSTEDFSSSVGQLVTTAVDLQPQRTPQTQTVPELQIPTQDRQP